MRTTTPVLSLFRRQLPLLAPCGVALAALLLSQVGSAGQHKPRAGVGSSLSQADLVSIYRAWFDSPYSYMFDQTGSKVITIKGRGYGVFLGGISGIVRYGSISEGAAVLLKLPKPRTVYDLEPLEKLAQLKIYTKKTSTIRSFNHYNPKIIRWGHQNLIPDPKGKVWGHTFQQLYDSVFSRFFRLMAESYLYLHGKKGPKKEVRAYLRAMKRRNFDGIDYLHQRYANALPGYRVPQNSTNFTAPMAIGFWIRRSVDKTDGELWLGLQKLLQRYDHTWWAKTKKGARPVRGKRS